MLQSFCSSQRCFILLRLMLVYICKDLRKMAHLWERPKLIRRNHALHRRHWYAKLLIDQKAWNCGSSQLRILKQDLFLLLKEAGFSACTLCTTFKTPSSTLVPSLIKTSQAFLLFTRNKEMLKNTISSFRREISLKQKVNVSLYGF